MKKIRPLYAIGSLAITAALCLLIYIVLQPKDRTPTTVHKTVTPESQTTATPQAATTPATDSEEQPKQNQGATTEPTAQHTETDPYIEGLKKLIQSPAYEEYRKSQEGVFGVDMNAWWDFMESQGRGSGRTLQNRDFQKLFPHGGTAADYEPEMRKKVAELALANPTYDTVQLLSAFWKQDKANYIWNRQYFSGHVGDYDWVDNIRQNPENVLAELTSTDTENDTVPRQPMPLFTTDAPTEQSEDTGTATENALSPQTATKAPETEAAEGLRDDLSNLPNVPTAADIQKTLTERFSPQRLNNALQILTQYGPTEGLQRLKESDAEIATHLERLLQQHKETNERER